MTDVFAAGGLSRPKGYGLSARGSNDKPEMGPSVFRQWRPVFDSHDWKITWVHRLINNYVVQGLLYPKFWGIASKVYFDMCLRLLPLNLSNLG